MSVLHIDTRETALAKAFPAGVIEPLDIGDVGLSFQGELCILIERKTVTDWVASIRDGRYKEQKARLMAWRSQNPNMRQCIYLLEGFSGWTTEDDDTALMGHSSVSRAAFKSSVLNTLFRDHIPVVTTQSLQETCAFVELLYKRFSADPGKYIQAEGGGTAEGYIDLIKTKKSKNVTPDNALVLQLAQIPGISTKIAKAVSDIHPNMAHFIRALDTIVGDKDRHKYVQKLPLPSEGGTNRTVGAKTADKILSYLGYEQ